VVDSTKGLTISKQNDDESQWLRTWFLDTEKTEQNTKIVLRNDFSPEYFDWRKDSESSDKTKNLLTEIPAEAVNPVSSNIRFRISLAMSLADSIPFLFSVTSR
jgi:hypothetical protein